MPEPHQANPRLPAELFVLMATVAIVGCNSLLLGPILGDVAISLATTPVAASRAIACYGGATAASAVLLGPRIDRLGSGHALRGGVACLLAATLASATSAHWLMLALAQGLAGLGAGMALPSSYALAMALAPAGQQSRALGRVLTGWSISLVAGVPLSAWLAEAAGWRASFLVLAAFAALALAGTWRLPGRRHEANGGAPGGLLAPLAYPGVVGLLAICLAFMASFYGVYAFLGDHVRTLLGVSAGRAGLIVLSYGVGFGIASLGDGVVDRVGARRLFPAVLAVLAAIFALIGTAAHHYGAMVALAGAWGLANHFGLSILVLLLGRARPAQRGAVLGLNSAVTYLGAMLGVAGAGVIYGTAGFAAVTHAAATLLALAAAIAAFGLGRSRSASLQEAHRA